MKLIESDAEGPIVEESTTTPPRPEKRRVSISLLFTLAVLVGTVVTIYTLLPARNQILVTEAFAGHRRDRTTFDVVGPTGGELQAWTTGALGKQVPMFAMPGAAPLAAAVITIHRRNASLVRSRVGTEEFTVLMQHAQGWAPESAERDDGELHASLKRVGPWTVVTVGLKATMATWLPMVHVLAAGK